MSVKKGFTILTSVGLLSSLVIGCGNANKSSDAVTASSQPVAIDNSPATISVFFQDGYTDDVYQKMFLDPIKKAYPNITLEVAKNVKGNTLQDLVAAGNVPDIIYMSNVQMASYLDLGLFDDISPEVKNLNVDLSRFRPETLDSIKANAPHGELYGLPFAQNYEVLYYNKDIFDKFGVSYPKDGMSWDDAMNLAMKVARTDSGVQYSGLGLQSVHYYAFPLGLPYADDKAGKAVINNDKWKEIFDLTHNILSLPNNQKSPGWPNFLKDKTVAMVTDWTQGPLQTLGGASNTLNWDVAQLPSLKELPNVNGTVDAHVLLLTKTSKHKDQAMEVMKTLTSDEVQAIGSRMGNISPLNNTDVQKQFAADLPNAKGKNLQGIFKSHQVTAPVRSKYYANTRTIIDKYWKKVADGSTDINSALRDAEDEANKFIATQGNK